MPNSRKPSALKVVAGTDRADRAVEGVTLPIIRDCPEPPDWLPNAHAVKEWNRLAPILTSAGLLTEAGVSALATLCALHGKLVQLWQAGESPNGAMIGGYRNLINDFGLTPVAQGKVKPMGAKQEANEFETNKRVRS